MATIRDLIVELTPEHGWMGRYGLATLVAARLQAPLYGADRRREMVVQQITRMEKEGSLAVEEGAYVLTPKRNPGLVGGAVLEALRSSPEGLEWPQLFANTLHALGKGAATVEARAIRLRQALTRLMDYGLVAQREKAYFAIEEHQESLAKNCKDTELW